MPCVRFEWLDNTEQQQKTLSYTVLPFFSAFLGSTFTDLKAHSMEMQNSNTCVVTHLFDKNLASHGSRLSLPLDLSPDIVKWIYNCPKGKRTANLVLIQIWLNRSRPYSRYSGLNCSKIISGTSVSTPFSPFQCHLFPLRSDVSVNHRFHEVSMFADCMYLSMQTLCTSLAMVMVPATYWNRNPQV